MLTRQERLSGSRRVSLLFEGGDSGFVYPFRYVFSCRAEGEMAGRRDTGEAAVSVLVSVSKRWHRRANRRNTLKRRTREAYRQGKHALAAAAVAKGVRIDVALVYVSKDMAEFKTIENAVGKILVQIAERV